MARISPLAKADWSAEMTTFIDGFRTAVLGDAVNDDRPAGANLLGTFARHPALAKAFLTFNGHLLYGSTLSARQRELLVLRVATVQQSDYEWAQHVSLAEDAGLRPEEIARIVQGPQAPEWSSAERSLLAAADELLADGVVSGDTWRDLAREFTDQQLMDLVFTVGTYGLMAMALRSFDVTPDPDLVRYLPGSR